MKAVLQAALLFFIVCLFVSSAEAGCYRCTFTTTGTPACESRTSGWVECSSWGSSSSMGCEASGDRCGSSGFDPEEPMVLNRCGAAQRLVLTAVVLPARAREPRVVLTSVSGVQVRNSGS